MKKLIALVIVLMISLITGCGQSNAKETSNGSHQNAELKEQTTITVVAPKSPATIPVLRMIESNCMGDEVKIDLQLYGDMETMMAMASEGDYGILIVPAHTAANLNHNLFILLGNSAYIVYDTSHALVWLKREGDNFYCIYRKRTGYGCQYCRGL